MAKTRQVLHFVDYGKEYKVVNEINCFDRPYRIYNIYNEIGKDGFIHSHKKLVERCDSLGECFRWFYLNVY